MFIKIALVYDVKSKCTCENQNFYATCAKR